MHVLERVDADGAWQVVLDALDDAGRNRGRRPERRRTLAFARRVRLIPPAIRAHPTADARRATQPDRVAGRAAGDLRPHPRRRRPGELPVGRRRRHRRGSAASSTRSLLARRRSHDDADLPPEERARRERLREGAGGDHRVRHRPARRAVPRSRSAGSCSSPTSPPATRRHLDVPGPGVRPALVARRAIGSPTSTARAVGDRPRRPRPARRRPHADDRRHVSAGAAPSSSPPRRWAAIRGFWWSPDGTRRSRSCRVDDAPVADLAHLRTRRTRRRRHDVVRYPAAGTPNADVTLHVLPARAARHPSRSIWDHDAFEYLGEGQLERHGLTITVQSRRPDATSRCSSVDTATGSTSRRVPRPRRRLGRAGAGHRRARRARHGR